MSPPADKEWTICYGYRVGGDIVADIDVLDPDFKPIVLRCPMCGENAWFSETLLKNAWIRARHRPELRRCSSAWTASRRRSVGIISRRMSIKPTKKHWHNIARKEEVNRSD